MLICAFDRSINAHMRIPSQAISSSAAQRRRRDSAEEPEEPEAAADIFVRHMAKGGFKRSFPYGFSLVFRLSQFLPDWLYYRLFGARG